MGPISALDSVFTKFFTLRGRASRSEYWWFALMSFVILLAAIAGDVFLFDPSKPISINPMSYFSLMWILITIIPNFTVSIRRLHDSGKSGAYYFVLFVPFVGSIIFLILMCLPSDHNQNHWGSPPFGPRGSQYDGHDIGHVGLVPKVKKAHNPYAGYALLDQARTEPTPEMLAARKEAVSQLYQTRVLGRKSTETPA